MTAISASSGALPAYSRLSVTSAHAAEWGQGQSLARVQVRVAGERAMARYQEPPTRFSAARIRKKAAHG